MDCHMNDLAHPPADRLWHLICVFRQRGPAPAVVGLARALTSEGVLGLAGQQALLSACLLSPAAAMLPIDAEYKRRVLRAAVLAAEEDGQEVCEELMEQYSACLLGPAAAGAEGGSTAGACWPSAPQPGWCYKLFAYAPAGEAAAETMLRLSALERRAAQLRCGGGEHAAQQACWQQEQQQQQSAEQRQQQRAEQQGQQQAEREGRGAAPPPLPAAAALGGRRHGLLALHVSLNLLEGGTGCHEWEAGFFLAEWVLSHPELVAGRCCLEVGCGAGMVGVALHRACARHIILTDGNPEAVANCRRNLALNGVPLLPEAAGSAGAGGWRGGSPQQGHTPLQDEQRWVQCRTLCWEDGWHGGGDTQQAQQAQHPTVVLGADLLYDPTVIPVLLGLVKQVLLAAAAAARAAADEQAGGRAAAAGAQEQQQQQQAAPGQHPPAVYLATTLRNEATLQQFLAAAEADPDISIQQLVPQPAATGGSPCGSSSGGSPPPAAAAAPPAGSERLARSLVEPAAAATDGAGRQAVRLQHLPELDAARARIFLHRLVLSAPTC